MVDSRFFPVKLTRLKRRAENAEELVRLQPPGLRRRRQGTGNRRQEDQRYQHDRGGSPYCLLVPVPCPCFQAFVRLAAACLASTQDARVQIPPNALSVRVIQDVGHLERP